MADGGTDHSLSECNEMVSLPATGGATSKMRPESRPTILLPVRSVGMLMNAHFTQVAKWRRRAIEDGILSNTSRYVRRSLADEFAVKADFYPLDDGPSRYTVKRGRKPNKPLLPDQAF